MSETLIKICEVQSFVQGQCVNIMWS